MFPLGATTTVSLGVLLNTWPVNNCMKGQSTCATGPRVCRECTVILCWPIACTHTHTNASMYQYDQFSFPLSSLPLLYLSILVVRFLCAPYGFSPSCSSSLLVSLLTVIRAPWGNVNPRGGRGPSRGTRYTWRTQTRASMWRKHNHSYTFRIGERVEYFTDERDREWSRQGRRIRYSPGKQFSECSLL